MQDLFTFINISFWQIIKTRYRQRPKLASLAIKPSYLNQKDIQRNFRIWNDQIITKTYLFKYTENFTTKKWKFSDKKILIFFHVSAQNIDCEYSSEPPRRGGSDEYPQSMFWAEISEKMYTPVNPSFTILKWGLRGSKLYRHVFVMYCCTRKILYSNSKWITCRQTDAFWFNTFFFFNFLPNKCFLRKKCTVIVKYTWRTTLRITVYAEFKISLYV